MDTLSGLLNPLDRSDLHCTEQSAQALHSSSLPGKVWIHLNLPDRNCLECKSPRLTRPPDSNSPQRRALGWKGRMPRKGCPLGTASCSWTQRGSRTRRCTACHCSSGQGRSCLHRTSSGSPTRSHTRSPPRTAAGPTRWGRRSRHCTSSGRWSPWDRSCPEHSSQRWTHLPDNSSPQRTASG